MTLKGQIQEDMKTAMKAGDKDRLKVVRLMLAAIKQIEIDQRIELDDPAVLAVLNKMVKQRRDSVSQFQKAELVAKLRAARERSGNLGGPERYPTAVVKLAKRHAKKGLSLRR